MSERPFTRLLTRKHFRDGPPRIFGIRVLGRRKTERRSRFRQRYVRGSLAARNSTRHSGCCDEMTARVVTAIVSWFLYAPKITNRSKTANGENWLGGGGGSGNRPRRLLARGLRVSRTGRIRTVIVKWWTTTSWRLG